MSTRDTPWPAGSPAWVDLTTDDLPSTRKTYGRLFGWDTDDSPAEQGQYVTCLKNSRAAAGLLQPEQGEPIGWLVYFASDDAAATTAKAREAGATVLYEPSEVGAGAGTTAVLQDPSGAVFGLWQAGAFSGLQIVDEPGAFGGTTLLTRDVPTAQDFYGRLFGYTYAESEPGLVAIHAAGQPVGFMHHAEQWPQDQPPAWNVQFAVASRDATIGLAELEDDVEVLMSFETPFGAEAVLRGPRGEVFTITEAPEDQAQDGATPAG